MVYHYYTGSPLTTLDFDSTCVVSEGFPESFSIRIRVAILHEKWMKHGLGDRAAC